MLLHGSVLLCGEEEGGVDSPTSEPVSASDCPVFILCHSPQGVELHVYLSCFF